MLNFGDGNNPHMLFEVDGAVNLDDRQHLLDCYSGIAFASAVVGTVFGSHMRSIPDFGQSIISGRFS